jgi:hypothetical protein
MRHSFKVMHDELYTVKVRISPGWARWVGWVGEKIWHESHRITKLPDGCLELLSGWPVSMKSNAGYSALALNVKFWNLKSLESWFNRSCTGIWPNIRSPLFPRNE